MKAYLRVENFVFGKAHQPILRPHLEGIASLATSRQVADDLYSTDYVI